MSITPIDIKELDKEQVLHAKNKLRGTHSLLGSTCIGSPQLIAFKIPKNRFKLSNINFVPVLGSFGISINLLASENSEKNIALVHILKDDPGYEILKQNNFYVVFFYHGKAVSAYNITTSDIFRNNILNKTEKHKTPYNNRNVHFYEALYTLTNDAQRQNLPLTPHDELSIGWYLLFLRKNIQFENLLEKDLPLNLESIQLDENLVPYANILISFLNDYKENQGKLIECFYKYIETDPIEHFCNFCNLTWKTVEYSDYESYHKILNCLIDIYRIHPSLTGCGRFLVSLDTINSKFNKLEINPLQFDSSFSPKDYWVNLQYDAPFLNSNHLIFKYDVPIIKKDIVNGLMKFDIKGDIEVLRNSADDLLQEAITYRRWTIPNKALFELNFGPFSRVELSEIDNLIYCVFRTHKNHFYIGNINPSLKIINFPIKSDIFKESIDAIGNEKIDRIIVGIKLLLAALIRDFWVIEERSSAFQTRQIRYKKEKNYREQNDDPLIVYLPRVKYTYTPNINKLETTLQYKERRVHFVKAHLRRSQHASPYQIALARKRGENVPIGYTYVREHERGGKKKEVIYRSKSALKSLYTVMDTDAKHYPNKWFRFERDVYDFMKSQGFNVEHVSASSRADNGIDLIAKKGKDFDEVIWIIQCKCYSLKNKVGPNIVRELIGTLDNCDKGTRGMIITTSDFTAGARKESRRSNIRLIDGKEFLFLKETKVK